MSESLAVDNRKPESRDNPEIIEFFDCCLKSSTNQAESLLKRKSLIELINGRDRNGRSLLHYCAECTGTLCASLLITSRPNSIINQDNDGYTILHLAVINGNTPMVSYLTSQVKLYVPESLFIQFLNSGDTEGHTAFHWATVCNEIKCLDILYSSGASASLPDIHGAHPVHYAAQMTAPSNNINRDVRIGLKVLRKILSYQKVDPNCRDKDGRTPLLWASSSGSSEAIMMLVNSGADIASCDKDGLTALHCASSRGHVESAEALINMCGAEIDVIDSIGCSPLFYAVTLGHADCTQLLLESGAEPNRQDLKGRTAAHCGAVKGQFETIKILASHGANLWYRNVRGDLPLHEAIKSGRKELVRWLLQQLPSAVNTTNSIGRSPLHIAASDNNVEMCKVLIDSGSEINPLMKSKGHLMTPLDCALQKNYRSCAKFLLLHGALPASRLNLNSRTLNQKRLSARSPAKGHVSPKVYAAQPKSHPGSRENCFSSTNTNSDLHSVTNMESVEQHHDDGKTRTSITKRKVAVYRNNGSSPDYSYSTSRSRSSGFQSQSIITNVYVNTISKHKMAPLKRIKRRSKLNTSDSSQSSSLLNGTQSQGANINTNSDKESIKLRKNGLDSLSNTKIKLRQSNSTSIGTSGGSTLRSRGKSKGLSNSKANDRSKLTSQSLDRETSKRGQINNKRSLIGKSIVKHPHASDVDLSVDVTEQVINSNDNEAQNDADDDVNYDGLRGQIESSESFNNNNVNDDNKGISESASEAEDYSEDSQIEDSSVDNQETSESAVGSLGSHELPILGSDDSYVDNDADENGNASDDQVSEERKELAETDENDADDVSNESSNKVKCQQKKHTDFKLSNEDECHENDDSKSDCRARSESRCSHRLHHRPLPSTGPIDLSHVTAKVDTRGLDLVRRPNSEVKANKDQIKAETNEMMAKVERSLRKYQLERKIFQELQDLKRCQIRSGRVNEPVLVKRLVEKFRKEVKSPGMVDFSDSFTYRSYERFLYDQLRKLSSSNQGKVLPIIKSVSDENLALKFMTTDGVDNQFNGFNNNHSIHHRHGQSPGQLYRQPGKSGLRQKSVSAMSSFNQSKFKKDVLPSINLSNNQRKEKLSSIEISKDSVIPKIYDSEKFKSNKTNINNNVINNNNNNNITNNNNNNIKNSVPSSCKVEIEGIKRIESSNIPVLTRDSKIKTELKQVKDHSVDKKFIKEPIKATKISEVNQPVDKVKSSPSGEAKDPGPLIVISSISDVPKKGKVKTTGKDGTKRRSEKSREVKKEVTKSQEKVAEVKKLVKRGSSNMSIREIRRTTAKHEQYKNLRGSHRRICLKSSDADSKPYVEAAINRPKFKRCKSSIPARFKVNIPLAEIERRWRLIKNAERKKSAEQPAEREKQADENGHPLEFLLLYEINRERKVGDYDYVYDRNYNVYDDDDDYSGQETEYGDETDHEHRLNHLLKRTLSEPALLPRDLTV